MTVIAAAPVKDAGATIVGYTGVTVKLPEVQSMVEQIKPFGDGFAMVRSGGIVAAHTYPERLGKNMRESESDTFVPFFGEVVEAVARGTPASFSYRPFQSNADYQYYATPFAIGHVPQPWTLAVAVSRDVVMAPVYRMLTICIIIGVLTCSSCQRGDCHGAFHKPPHRPCHDHA